MMQTARRGIDVNEAAEDVTYQIGDSDRESRFNIDQLLPEHAIRHAHYLVDNKFVPIAPLPATNTEAKNFKGLVNIFRRDHLGNIYSQFLSR
jgi:hypothetical protein